MAQEPIGPAEGEALRRLQRLVDIFREQAACFDEAGRSLLSNRAGAAVKHEKQRIRDAYLDCANRLAAALAPLSGPVDASGEPRKILTAPCRWCGYNGPSYWSEGTHATTCRWRKIGGEVNRLAVLADHPVEAMRAAAVPSSPDLTATLRALAIYCFQKHGNDAYLYNALADLVGPEAMRAVPSSPAQDPD